MVKNVELILVPISVPINYRLFRFSGFPSKLAGEWTEMVKNVELILVMGCFGTGIPVFGTFSVFRGNRPGCG